MQRQSSTRHPVGQLPRAGSAVHSESAWKVSCATGEGTIGLQVFCTQASSAQSRAQSRIVWQFAVVCPPVPPVPVAPPPPDPPPASVELLLLEQPKARAAVVMTASSIGRIPI